MGTQGKPGLSPNPGSPEQSGDLKPETVEDLPFLLKVYASTRAEEMTRVPWDEKEKEEFVRSQFGFQRTHYLRYYPEASFDVILIEGVRAGRLYVHRQPATVHILDIALLPEYRGRGIGRALIGKLQREAAAHGSKVSIYVERFNPALRLYERMGFRQSGEQGPVYLYMEWLPAA